LDGIEYHLYPTYKIHWQGPEFDFTPGLSLRFSGKCQEKQLMELSNTLIRFIQYSFMRINIYPDEIEFNNTISKGNIFIPNYDLKDEGKEKIDIYSDYLPWIPLYKVAGALFASIKNEEIHLLHLPDEKIKRLWIDNVSISKDSAAFEAEFDRTYPEGVPYSEERKQMEKEVIDELTPLIEASKSKKKKIYKGFIKHVHAESLCDKMEFALFEYKDCISKLKIRFANELTFEEIAEACSGIRNDVDHGIKIEEINQNSAIGFALIRGLIYAIQLRRYGLKDDEINICTNMLFLLPQVRYMP